jgi:N-acetylmuramoyl-L-alanine amidase
MKIVISSGHGLKVRGAAGIIDEVDEARRVVAMVADLLLKNGHSVTEFHDDTSTTQSENLDTIVNFHNSQDRDVDVSVHFNAYNPTTEPRGTEVLYLTQESLATRMAKAIAAGGAFINRGAKYNGGLAFLNGTDKPSILIEVCFVDSEADAQNYTDRFNVICKAIAAVADERLDAPLAVFSGPCSWFGGPDDTGVAPDEGLAFIYEVDQHLHLFLDKQPPGTTGLARRLDPGTPYVACRWDYAVTPKDMLAGKQQALIRAGSKEMKAWPADWGPHEDTKRAADLSPGLMEALGLKTDDEVSVIYPATKKKSK